MIFQIGLSFDCCMYDYAGKVLSNDAPISEYKVQENNFMVVMVSKTKPSKNPTVS